MKTQISILVKNESLYAKCKSFLWFVNIFQKSKMIVMIDGKENILKASKTPYVFDVTPGYHSIQFKDKREGSKRSFDKFTKGFTGFAIGLGGGASTAMDMAATFTSSGINIQDNLVEIQLQDGDILKLSCKADRKGRVKVKQI